MEGRHFVRPRIWLGGPRYGIVVGAGEIFGGGIAPVIAGYVGQSSYGIQNILYLALAGVAIGIVACMFLKETAPRKLQAQRDRAMVSSAAEP